MQDGGNRDAVFSWPRAVRGEVEQRAGAFPHNMSGALIMGFRVSVFFTQQVATQTGGWTENYWNNLTDASALATVMANWLPLRFALTGYGISITAYRSQDLSTFRAALPVPLGTQYSTQFQNLPSDGDYPTTKGLLRFFGPTKYLTNQWLGGVQDANVTRGGTWTPSPSYLVALNAWFAHLAAGGNGWCIYSQDKSVVKTLVTAVTALGQVTSVGHGLASGQKVRISRTHGITGLNKVWTVASIIDSSNFQIAPPVGGFAGSLQNPLGTAQRQSRILQAISSAIVVRATKHNTGRPSFLLSGRRKKRVS
jgi:hypothetical protein